MPPGILHSLFIAGIDFFIKEVTVDSRTLKLKMTDTAGQARFDAITKSCFRNTHGIAVLYDITDRDSFKAIRAKYLPMIEQNARSNVCRVIIGCKSDLESNRQVSIAEGEALARELGVRFFETSARTNKNIKEAIDHLARDMKGTFLGENAGGSASGRTVILGEAQPLEASNANGYCQC